MDAPSLPRDPISSEHQLCPSLTYSHFPQTTDPRAQILLKGRHLLHNSRTPRTNSASTTEVPADRKVSQFTQQNRPSRQNKQSSVTSNINTGSSLSSRRCIDLDIDRFQALSLAHDEHNPVRDMIYNVDAPCLATSPIPQCRSDRPVFHHTLHPPLTPPHEKDVGLFSGLYQFSVQQASNQNSSEDVGSSTGTHSCARPASAPSGYSSTLVDNAATGFQAHSSAGIPWLTNAIRAATGADECRIDTSSSKIVSQVLPCCGSDQRRVKTYEAVCEHLQNSTSGLRYVAIFHALGLLEGRAVHDLPQSQPSTPNFVGGDSYFGGQNRFTHLAEVPVYHEYNNSAGTRIPQRNIMPPEANLVILESSQRSYLADRLNELAVDGGSMLLIYPTKRGATTFVKQLLGPALDPVLRQMVILRGLKTDLAERIGSMKSLDAMMDFDTMKYQIENVCSAMNATAETERSQCFYSLTCRETADVTLDRKTWMAWFIEQEQHRFKQDFVDYHKEGGMLAQGEAGNNDLTAGMLAREIISSLQKEMSGMAQQALEVGIFVIKRLKRT